MKDTTKDAPATPRRAIANPRRRRIGGLAALAAGVLAALWLWISPQWALDDLRDAAARGDRRRIAGRVDLPALREDLSEQIAATLAGILAQQGGSGRLTRDTAMQAMAMSHQMVDRMVSDKALGTMLAADAAKGPGVGGDVGIVRESPRRFVAGAPGSTAGVVFALQGVTWRVVGVRLPARPTGATTPRQPATGSAR